MQVLAAAHKALAGRGGLQGDVRAEKALVSLLSLPITRYDVVTGLGLSECGAVCVSPSCSSMSQSAYRTSMCEAVASESAASGRACRWVHAGAWVVGA